MEEIAKKKSELNNELNNYKKKWNILEANRQLWSSIKTRLTKGQNKSKSIFRYHLYHTILSLMLATTSIMFPYTLIIAIAFYIKSFYHIAGLVICGANYVKLKRGVKATIKIEERYCDKKQEIEQNEEKLYRQIDEIENSLKTTPSLFEKCIERTANFEEVEECTL